MAGEAEKDVSKQGGLVPTEAEEERETERCREERKKMPEGTKTEKREHTERGLAEWLVKP